MKRIFTITAALLLGLASASAQSVDHTTLTFIDGDGNTVADGSTINCTASKGSASDGNLEMVIPLSVRNNTSDEVPATIALDITSLPTGTSIQSCWPENCQFYEAAGSHVNQPGIVNGSETKNLSTEWKPMIYDEDSGEYTEYFGTAETTVQILLTTSKDSKEVKAYGPKVTVKFVHADPTGISSGLAGTADASVVAVYSASGARLSAPQKGLNIFRLSNGKVVKRVIGK